ncbi:MAG: hypothetical protein IK115_12340 [Lachnospiraceae bacterium]|nr:hypothetical protein [Lachnospiraceae bacterium]
MTYIKEGESKSGHKVTIERGIVFDNENEPYASREGFIVRYDEYEILDTVDRYTIDKVFNNLLEL